MVKMASVVTEPEKLYYKFSMKYITTGIEKTASDVMYLDFQKAFDKVPHERLLCKIKAHGTVTEIMQLHKRLAYQEKIICICIQQDNI